MADPYFAIAIKNYFARTTQNKILFVTNDWTSKRGETPPMHDVLSLNETNVDVGIWRSGNIEFQLSPELKLNTSLKQATFSPEPIEQKGAPNPADVCELSNTQCFPEQGTLLYKVSLSDDNKYLLIEHNDTRRYVLIEDNRLGSLIKTIEPNILETFDWLAIRPKNGMKTFTGNTYVQLSFESVLKKLAMY